MLIALLALFLLLSSKGKPDGERPTPRDEADENWEPPTDVPKGAQALRDYCRAAGLNEEQTTMLVFIARGESGWNPMVGMGDPALAPDDVKIRVSTGEAKAARLAYERNAHRFEECDWPASQYQFGSGGLFAMLPTYALYHLRNTPLKCASPYQVFDPAFAITAAYQWLRSLTLRDDFGGTVASLRAGWWWPGAMDNPEKYAVKVAKWRKHLAASGINPDWLDMPAPKFPARSLMQMYNAMGGQL